MRIELKKLILTNFKGVKSLEVEFNHTSNIHGENGSGKSTIFDAFTWLLFGKDSHDSKDFEIKTLENGKAIPMIDHSVEGILTVDGTEITLKRVYREKWTRRRGSDTSDLTGHETLFYVDNVPQSATEYKNKIDGIVSESLFKLLTSTLYFNQMKWQDRRQVLVTMAGKIELKEVMTSLSKDVQSDIKAIMDRGKKLIEYKKEIAVLKKKLQDDLNLIPSRVDEVRRATPDPINESEIKAAIKSNQNSISEIEKTIEDQVASYQEQGEKVQAAQTKIFDLKKRQQQIAFEILTDWQTKENQRQMEANQAAGKLKNAQTQLKALELSKESLERQVASEQSIIKQLRDKWGAIDDEVLTVDESKLSCPTCKRPFDADKAFEVQNSLMENFNTDKRLRLSSISSEGKTHADTVTRLTTQVTDVAKQIEQAQTEVAKAEENVKAAGSSVPLPKPSVTDNVEFSSLKDMIDKLQLSILEVPKLDIDGLKQQKAQFQVVIDDLNRQLTVTDVIKKSETRLNELLADEKNLAQQISELERREFAIEAFTKSHMDLVEAKVNGMFTIVRWRMFESQLNGGQAETCECLVRGVPYSDCNSAGKIQAGVDIINAMSKYHDTYCPVWIDNRESTNEIPETQCQVVNLVVSKDKNLVIK